jgi:cell division septation protein DedD
MEALDPIPNQNEGPGVVNIPRRRGGFLSFIKHLFVFILLVGVIVASFWVSFNLGRRLLVPVKELPARKIEVAIPEPPPSIAALQEFEEIVLVEEEEESKPASEPIAPKATEPKAKKDSAAGATKYYKVQAGVFAEKANADSLAKKLRTNGFDTYIRKVSKGWRVQVGAFIGKKWALNLQQSLKARGFQSMVIYE